MHSATLPPDLATIAREAMRDGPPTPTPARPARVIGLGHHVPAEVVPNGAIAERIGVDDAWIVKRTGIKSRRRVARVLVVGAEALTRLIDYDDPKTAALFGDGAGAVVVGAEGEGDIGPIVLAADGSLGDRITCSNEERVLRMDGHSTYQVAVKRLSEATVAAVARAGLELDDVDLFVYHQANGRIIRAVGERLDLPPPRVGR